MDCFLDCRDVTFIHVVLSKIILNGRVSTCDNYLSTNEGKPPGPADFATLNLSNELILNTFRSYRNVRQEIAVVLIFHVRDIVQVPLCEHTCEEVIESFSLCVIFIPSK